MKYKELTTKSEAEIKQLLAELKTEVHDLSVKLRLNQLKNPKSINSKKKDIARIMTFFHKQSAISNKQ